MSAAEKIADPIFAALASQRAAAAVSNAAFALEPNGGVAAEALLAVEKAVAATVPTTLVGLRALIDFAAEEYEEDDSAAIAYFAAILAACRALLPDAPEGRITTPRDDIRRMLSDREDDICSLPELLVAAMLLSEADKTDEGRALHRIIAIAHDRAMDLLAMWRAIYVAPRTEREAA